MLRDGNRLVRRIVTLATPGIAGLLIPTAAAAVIFSVEGSTPDHSQHSDITWTNYCGPTTGSDWVYYFAQTYPALRQGNPLPPDLAADPGADAVITELATRMGTTFTKGTSSTGLAAGIEEYLDLHDGTPSIDWTTRFHLFQGPTPVGPAELSAFLADVQGVLTSGGGVILLLQWTMGAPPGGIYDLPSEDQPDNDDLMNGTVNLGHSLGHVVAMVGYDDLMPGPPPPPLNNFYIHDAANNAGTHLWAGDIGTTQIEPFDDSVKTTFYPELTVASTQAAVIGALIIENQPVVPSLGLLGVLMVVGLILLAGAALLRGHSPPISDRE